MEGGSGSLHLLSSGQIDEKVVRIRLMVKTPICIVLIPGVKREFWKNAYIEKSEPYVILVTR